MLVAKTLLIGSLLAFPSWAAADGEYFSDSFGGPFNPFNPSHWTTISGSFVAFTNGVHVASYAADGTASAEHALDKPLPPGDNFQLELELSVRTDPANRVGAFTVLLLDDANNVVAKMNWHDAQTASGYGGVDFGAQGTDWATNPIYRTNPSGFGREYPTLNDARLEIRRSGNQWKAFVNSVQKGGVLTFNPTLTATKVRIQLSDGRYTPPAFEVTELQISEGCSLEDRIDKMLSRTDGVTVGQRTSIRNILVAAKATLRSMVVKLKKEEQTLAQLNLTGATTAKLRSQAIRTGTAAVDLVTYVSGSLLPRIYAVLTPQQRADLITPKMDMDEGMDKIVSELMF